MTCLLAFLFSWLLFHFAWELPWLQEHPFTLDYYQASLADL